MSVLIGPRVRLSFLCNTNKPIIGVKFIMKNSYGKSRGRTHATSWLLTALSLSQYPGSLLASQWSVGPSCDPGCHLPILRHTSVSSNQSQAGLSMRKPKTAQKKHRNLCSYLKKKYVEEISTHPCFLYSEDKTSETSIISLITTMSQSRRRAPPDGPDQPGPPGESPGRLSEQQPGTAGRSPGHVTAPPPSPAQKLDLRSLLDTDPEDEEEEEQEPPQELEISLSPGQVLANMKSSPRDIENCEESDPDDPCEDVPCVQPPRVSVPSPQPVHEELNLLGLTGTDLPMHRSLYPAQSPTSEFGIRYDKEESRAILRALDKRHKSKPGRSLTIHHKPMARAAARLAADKDHRNHLVLLWAAFSGLRCGHIDISIPAPENCHCNLLKKIARYLGLVTFNEPKRGESLELLKLFFICFSVILLKNISASNRPPVSSKPPAPSSKVTFVEMPTYYLPPISEEGMVDPLASTIIKEEETKTELRPTTPRPGHHGDGMGGYVNNVSIQVAGGPQPVGISAGCVSGQSAAPAMGPGPSSSFSPSSYGTNFMAQAPAGQRILPQMQFVRQQEAGGCGGINKPPPVSSYVAAPTLEGTRAIYPRILQPPKMTVRPSIDLRYIRPQSVTAPSWHQPQSSAGAGAGAGSQMVITISSPAIFGASAPRLVVMLSDPFSVVRTEDGRVWQLKDDPNPTWHPAGGAVTDQLAACQQLITERLDSGLTGTNWVSHSTLRFVPPGEPSTPYRDYWACRQLPECPPDNLAKWAHGNRGKNALQHYGDVIAQGRLIFVSGYVVTINQPDSWLDYCFKQVYSYAKLVLAEKMSDNFDSLPEDFKVAHHNQFICSTYFLELPQFQRTRERFLNMFFQGRSMAMSSAVLDTRVCLTKDFYSPVWGYTTCPGP